MDRTTEIFTRYSRGFSIVVAATFAISLQLDSVHIFEQLSVNEKARAQIVAQTDKIVDFQTSMEKIVEGTDNLASAALSSSSKQLPTQSESIPEGLSTEREGRTWIDNRIKQTQRDEWRRVYRKAYREQVLTHTDKLRSEIGDLAGVLEQNASLEIFSPKKDSGNRAAGILLTIIFPSLGAPFWFRILSILSNLRPVIAGKVDAEKREP